MQIRKNHFFNVIKLGEGEKNKYFESSSVCVNISASGHFENALTFYNRCLWSQEMKRRRKKVESLLFIIYFTGYSLHRKMKNS